MARYIGERDGEIRHGQGEYIYPGGVFSYTGAWVNGTKHGDKERFVIEGVSEYEGQFQNGEIQGQGVRRWHDGRVYSGQFHEGEMHGTGTWTHPNGERYDGEFVNNRRHGQGKLSTREFTYMGGFKQHRFHGAGMLLRASGRFDRGYFEDNQLTGNGDSWDHEIGRYTGEWQAGKPHGEGKFISTAPGTEVVGKFRCGESQDSARFIEIQFKLDKDKQHQEEQTNGQSDNKSTKRAPSKAAKDRDKQDTERLLLPAHQVKRGEPFRIEIQLLRALATQSERQVAEREEAEMCEEPPQLTTAKYQTVEVFACKVTEEIFNTYLQVPTDFSHAMCDFDQLAIALAAMERVPLKIGSCSAGDLADDPRRFWPCRVWPELTIAQFVGTACAHNALHVLKCGESDVVELEDDRGVRCIKQPVMRTQLPSTTLEAGGELEGPNSELNSDKQQSGHTTQPISAVLKRVELPEYLSFGDAPLALHIILDFRLLPPADASPDKEEEEVSQHFASDGQAPIPAAGEVAHQSSEVLSSAEITQTAKLLTLETPALADRRLEIAVRYTHNLSLTAEITTIQTVVGDSSLEWVASSATLAFEWQSIGIVMNRGAVEVFANGSKLQPVRLRNSAMERWRRSAEEFEAVFSESESRLLIGGEFECHYKGPTIFWSPIAEHAVVGYTNPFAQVPLEDKTTHELLCTDGRWFSADTATINTDQAGLHLLCVRDASHSQPSPIPAARPFALLVDIV